MSSMGDDTERCFDGWFALNVLLFALFVFLCTQGALAQQSPSIIDDETVSADVVSQSVRPVRTESPKDTLSTFFGFAKN